MMICGKCKTARYCDVACQRRHWPQHKDVCTEMGHKRELAKTPFFVACLRGDEAEVRRLVGEGANVNKAFTLGTTPLYLAVVNGHLSIAQYLVERGADVNKANNDGRTPLMIATEQNHGNVAQFLRSRP